MRNVGSDIIKTLVLAAVLFFVVQTLLQNYEVFGTSMEPSLNSGERILVSNAGYLSIDLGKLSKLIPFYEKTKGSRFHIFGEPKRGDVVVVRSPFPPPDRLVKRIVGLPGDTIEVKGSILFINNQRIEESYIKQSTGSLSCNDGPKYPYDIPEDKYFVLGDNRNHSNDSRCFWPIPRSDIIGKAWLTYWPLRVFGIVNSYPIEVPTEG